MNYLIILAPIFLILGAIFFSVVGSDMAKSRGLTGRAGVWIGFCLGPLGLLILCFMRPVPTQPVAAPKVSGALEEYRRRRGSA